MKIEYIKGDFMAAPETIMIQGCNALGVMGAGVARLIRSQHPAAYARYMKEHFGPGLVLGTIVWAASKGKMIGNAITQQNLYDGNSPAIDYGALAKIIARVDSKAVELGQGRVAMPKIGAGLAGGDWNVISKIIEDYSVNFTPVVYYID